MDERCELVYGYLHCIGRTQYHCGYAADKNAADQWARKNASRENGRMPVPDEDPVHWCPVRHCHMKRQQPWFGYRSKNGSLTIRRSDIVRSHP